MKITQNMLITICIVIAVCLVVVVFAYSGYLKTLQSTQTPVSATPVPTPEIVQTPIPTTATPVPTQQYDYLTLIQSGTAKIESAKISVQNGRMLIAPALATRNNYPNAMTVVYQSKQNFTTARNLFVGGQNDFIKALDTTPKSQQESLNVLISTLNADTRDVDLYIQSSDLAMASDWYNANDIYNQANILYQSNMQSTNQLLAAMNLIP